jgi:hypothetical protein
VYSEPRNFDRVLALLGDSTMIRRLGMGLRIHAYVANWPILWVPRPADHSSECRKVQP